ncbi:ABC transporter family protein [Tritrichomonas foetus]|uniref:ABC transporter family protein n=1 Tax=Tritrichomonas foetus TaxID=1144522 RepID=A0A1J4KF03_9EUKA|nr:ABC transporter family protein [Tritrichomonas foetus]|eukprot:OHT10015.1 ABC transporter family protein [Tritrichomonas foetus]
MRKSSYYDDDLKNPLGSWSELQPNFWRQVKALLKKQVLIKVRNFSAIIEIIVAFFITLITYLAHHFSKTEYAADISPVVSMVGPDLIMTWFMAFNDVRVALKPDNQKIRDLIDNTTYLKLGIYGGQIPYTNISLPGCSLIKFTNSYNEIEDVVYGSDSNGFAVEWVNSEDPDWYSKPSFKVYHQSSYGNAEREFFLELKNAVIKMRYHDTPEKMATSLSLTTQLLESNFAHPKIVQRQTAMAFSYALIAGITIVVATMPDMESIFLEKDNHVSQLSFLMGMSETAFWFTNFSISFIICLVCYVFISLILSFWFGMTGNEFSMILVMSILFIIAELWFQYFISTFLNTASSGRGITIVLILISFFLAFVHQFVTFNSSSSSPVLNHILCIFPISAFELFVMQGSIATYGNLPLFKWNDMYNTAYLCPPWIPFMWVAIDIVAYFLLFLLFNAINPRAFGSPLYSIKELFCGCCGKSKKKIQQVDAATSSNSYVPNNDNVVITVDNLSKIYEGSKSVKALDSVSFDVKRGEVIVMIGPNGAGKSTLINCISSSLQPTKGKITIMGGYDPHNIGVCFQENVIINELSVREHFELFGAYRGVPINTLKETIDYFASNMQLTEMLNNRAGDLSGGQKRKLCIGLSLLGNPGVVLMDEPTAGVDVQARQLIWKMIANLHETTTIVTSHALEEAEAVSSRLFIVSGGKIPFSGTSTELRQEYQCGYVLRVEREDGKAGPVLELAQSFVPNSKLADDREDTIRMPVDKSIPKFLLALVKKQDELGVISYTFSVEQLEDMLLKLIESEEL